jgi:hypothetical protein
MRPRHVGIRTICYAPGMVADVDPDFLPFDVTADPQPERRETAHMLSFWRQGLHREYPVTGLLSPKFSGKTGIAGSIFNTFVTNNPGYDVWFLNPYPHYFYLAHNIWEHGEIWYPGLCERAARVFAAAGIAIDLNQFPRSTTSTLLFSNFWAGTTNFWDQFMPFVSEMSKHAEQEPALFDECPYEHGTATYYSFIFERLFTTFLVMHPGIRARYSNWQRANILELVNETDKLMIREWGPMIDQWDLAGDYNADQRTVFRGIQKLSVLGMRINDPVSYSRIHNRDTHPIITHITVAGADFPEIERLIQDQTSARVLGHDLADDQRVIIHIACTTENVRRRFELRWP